MKAAVLHQLGKAPRYEDFEEPVAQPDEYLIRVRAASIKPVDRQMASGAHYASPKRLPVVCGIDGVGTLEDGSRVYFGGPRRPFGSMAERTVAPRAFCFPLPETLDDATAAALPNPGCSAYLVLTHQARLREGESVLILGATGTTGRIAVQVAKLLGASRVVGAGRNPQTLELLKDFGADATIQLHQTEPELIEAFRREGGKDGFNVVVDFLWGRATEMFLASVTQTEIAVMGTETRLIQVGESAGPTISLPAAVLRSRPVTIRGTAGIPSREALHHAMRQVLGWATAGKLRLITETVPLSQVEEAWHHAGPTRRLVLAP
jgi:NADPH:quinone reductase-like Zn-dependent oxidoreductase